MSRALRWLAANRLALVESVAISALATMHEWSWIYMALIVGLAGACYADGMEQGIRRATGRRPEGGAS